MPRYLARRGVPKQKEINEIGRTEETWLGHPVAIILRALRAAGYQRRAALHRGLGGWRTATSAKIRAVPGSW